MSQDQFKELHLALAAIGDAARSAERRGDDLGDHSISMEGGEAIAHAMSLVEKMATMLRPTEN